MLRLINQSGGDVWLAYHNHGVDSGSFFFTLGRNVSISQDDFIRKTGIDAKPGSISVRKPADFNLYMDAYAFSTR